MLFGSSAVMCLSDRGTVPRHAEIRKHGAKELRRLGRP